MKAGMTNAALRQDEHALVGFRANGVGGDRASEAAVRHHHPTRALHQANQPGHGKNPVIRGIVVGFARAQQVCERLLFNPGSLHRSDLRDARAERAPIGAGGNGFENVERILEVVQRSEEQGEAVIGARESEWPVQVDIVNAHRQREFAAQHGDAAQLVEGGLGVVDRIHFATQAPEKHGEIAIGAADVGNGRACEGVRDLFVLRSEQIGEDGDTRHGRVRIPAVIGYLDALLKIAEFGGEALGCAHERLRGGRRLHSQTILAASTIAVDMEIIAHRGSGRGWKQPGAPPENTLPAFAYAWSPEVDADAAELDVHLSRDGELIVIHDATLSRTTNGRGRVAEHTLAELRALDAGTWKHERYAGTRLPLLEEVIAMLPAGKRLFIEIKSGAYTVPTLAAVLARCGKPARQLPVIGFGMRTMAAARRALPAHECYVVTTFRGRAAFANALIRRVKAAGLDGIDCRYPVSRALLGRIADNGLKCVVWTVNSIAGARRLARFGACGITTDIPRLVREALD